MRRIYEQIVCNTTVFRAEFGCQASVTDAEGSKTEIDLAPGEIEDLKVALISPNVTGAKDLLASGECQLTAQIIKVGLQASQLVAGIHRLLITGSYGSQTNLAYALDVTIPSDLTDDETTFEDTLSFVATIGGGGGGITIDAVPTQNSSNAVSSGGTYTALAGKADGSIYQVGESGDPAVSDVAKVHAHSVELFESAVATGNGAVAEGYVTTASGRYSHAEGGGTTASGTSSHAEGGSTTASGGYSHAEGYVTTASGVSSHAEGGCTTASGGYSHAEGGDTTASGEYSHAEGNGTTASGDNQHVCGKYNVVDTNGDYALIVGNGSDCKHPSNAFAITWRGELVLFNNGDPVFLSASTLNVLINMSGGGDN